MRAIAANWLEPHFSMAGAATAGPAMAEMMAVLVNILMSGVESEVGV